MSKNNLQVLGQEAYHAATLRFRNLHKEDWERILIEERKLRGLSADSEEEKRMKKVKYFEDQLKKYQEKLEELNNVGN